MSDTDYQDIQGGPSDDQPNEVQLRNGAEQPDEQGTLIEERPDPAIEARARELGWKPKEEWRGDQSGWCGAEEYLDRPGTRRKEADMLRQGREEDARRIKALERTLTMQRQATEERIGKIETQTHERTVATLQQQIEAAAENGDMAEVRRLTGELTKTSAPAPAPKAGKEDGLHPDIVAFNEANPWMDRVPGSGDVIRAFAMEISAESPALEVRDVLEKALERYKAHNPKAFGTETSGNGQTRAEQPRYERTQKVSGMDTRGGSSAGTSTKKGWNDIPAAERDQAKKYLIGPKSQHNLFKDEAAYAAKYFESYPEG